MSFVWETPEEINLALAKRLSRIRKRRNLSQVQLSEKSNVSYGGMEIEVPQDRKSTFEPKVVKKRQKDISEIDQKIISM